MPSTDFESHPSADASVVCRDEAAVARFAECLAAVLPSRVMMALEGDLGAGKTTFVKKLAAAVGIPPAEVTSPTFTLVHLYEVPHHTEARRALRLVHMDAYRLSGVDEVSAIGWEELVAENGWLLVEWPERIASALPAERMRLHIEITGESSRTLHLEATTPTLKAAIDAAAVAFARAMPHAP
jgi:tRNA threonylcarbamoyladenosine biosynthesis protein TsaE